MSWIDRLVTVLISGAICGGWGFGLGLRSGIKLLFADTMKSESIRLQLIDRASDKIAIAYCARATKENKGFFAS